MHTPVEIEELLSASLEFPNLGIVEVEAEHPIPGIDGLMTRIKEHCLSGWDIPSSPEKYLKEIGAAKFERASFVDSAVTAAPI